MLQGLSSPPWAARRPRLARHGAHGAAPAQRPQHGSPSTARPEECLTPDRTSSIYLARSTERGGHREAPDLAPPTSANCEALRYRPRPEAKREKQKTGKRLRRRCRCRRDSNRRRRDRNTRKGEERAMEGFATVSVPHTMAQGCTSAAGARERPSEARARRTIVPALSRTSEKRQDAAGPPATAPIIPLPERRGHRIRVYIGIHGSAGPAPSRSARPAPQLQPIAAACSSPSSRASHCIINRLAKRGAAA